VAIEKILQDHSKQDYSIDPGNHRHEQRLPQAVANAVNYEKTADENVMHGQNLKIMLPKTRTLR
jgi:hypothetical protein